MCKVRIVHFATHDLRVPVSTNLFSDPDEWGPGNGNFSSPTAVYGCACEIDAAFMLVGDCRPRPFLEACPWHSCCPVYFQRTLCRWFWDNRAALGLDEEPEPESICPNCFVESECEPISLVLDLASLQEKTGDAEGHGARADPRAPTGGGGGELAPWEWWVKQRPMPRFPAPELFYSARIVDDSAAPDLAADSLGLHWDRQRAMRMAETLWVAKKDLKKGIWETDLCLYTLELDLSVNVGIQFFADDPMMLLLRMKAARRLVRETREIEACAAQVFRELQKYSGYTFTALNKMPQRGHCVTAAKGLYYVSREELDMADLDEKAIIEAYDGPLKRVWELTERLRLIREILQTLKAVMHKPARCAQDAPKRVVPLYKKRKWPKVR